MMNRNNPVIRKKVGNPGVCPRNGVCDFTIRDNGKSMYTQNLYNASRFPYFSINVYCYQTIIQPSRKK